MIRNLTLVAVVTLTATFAPAQSREITLTFVPAQTTVVFTLGDILHTVHGSFLLRSGVVHFTPATNVISGEIVVDGTSGKTGNNTRDRKMHKEVLESARYPDITFRPDRVVGQVLPQGTSTVQVQGEFGIHGSEHEIVVPAKIDLQPDHWKLMVHFDVPYVAWGLKDPSTFILRVGKAVVIDMQASGSSPWVTKP
jgi:polyisoprenoid-binding protein YceI